MRYIIKGGVWKNSEDEILKAAVMKYGLNQWSRISSLLVRKSAKQCKQRWYEWLDPSIKKTEWTREEQEKVLHLAKIFPSQWRTIAPIVDRTPMQCVEQYEKLLDLAQGKDLNDPNDPRRLRPGEIDPNPETKAARPDPIDMDEDEKEMLAEARVRLANTKGKKAKRKARGKLIEEARRLALLQKKRELKAAGIQYINHRIEKHHIKLQDRKYKGINYNRELAFERTVPDFVHETTGEEPEPDKKISNVSLQALEGQRRDEEEEIRRKIDQRRIKKLKERELDQAVSFQNKYQVKFTPQTKLQLPQPQLKDQDLELLGKINAVNEISEHTTSATRALVGNYSTRDQSQSNMRTPRAPNTVLREAQNIIALQHTETPLVGGMNNPIDITKKYWKLNSKSIGLAQLKETPRRQVESSNDAFGINIEEYERAWEEPSQSVAYVNAEQERQQQLKNEQKLKEMIKQKLKSLPKPKNEFTIEIPNVDNEEQKEMEIVRYQCYSYREMDAEDKLKILRQKKLIDQQKKFRQKTQAHQKNLPTPKELPSGQIYEQTQDQFRNEIEDILNYTVIQLIKEDIYDNSNGLGDISVAKELLQDERLKLLGDQNLDNIDQIWNRVRQQLYFDYEENKFINIEKLDEEVRMAIFTEYFRRTRVQYEKLNKKQQFFANRIAKLMKGYEMRNTQLEKEIQQLNDKIGEIETNKEVVDDERHIYRDRVQEFVKYHDMLSVKSNELQDKYQYLTKQLQELEQEQEILA
ncbi:unnamed protein product (macronuclear) [Paramecium tetraurelia]|uniref:Uncharacterized protein n=1 Tax=Paramecium tetraurelia TaxID=5888 RepID=A0DW21_PARTE|nr:uncharacterized protein GSPATT00020891001 [Paramecium tetraurelia]CAK87238.1 unnamed protein product [Paramecium tetraurelia]|eukprot:XP_001454635.1 hypothetical protein (macronuclear) [Paramecium tetraurelia strain d4-2]